MAVVETLRPTGEEVLQSPVLRFMTPLGEMSYYPENRTALSPLVGEPVQLTHTEAIIFEALMTQPESTVAYQELTRAMWDIQQASPADIHAIVLSVGRLRAKLGDKPISRKASNNGFRLIHTVPYAGYSLTDPTLGWERFKSREIISCETTAGQVRLRLPEMAVFSPLLGKYVQLTPIENELLKKLIDQPDNICTYPGILRDIWNITKVDKTDFHMIRLQVARLRKKLGDDGREPKLIYTALHIGLSLTPVDPRFNRG